MLKREGLCMRWRWNLGVVLAVCSMAGRLCEGQAGSAVKPPMQQAVPPDVREAITLEEQGKIAEATAAWQRVVKADPKNAQAYAQLGALEARQEHYSQAIAAYRVTRRLKPGMPGLELNYGLALFKSEKYGEAADVFGAELRRHPNGPEALRLTTLTGMAHYGAKDYKAAAPYLKKAAEGDPKSLPLLLTLAHCYLWTKQLDAVMDVYRQILEINPDSAEADMIAGEALDEKGDNGGAVQQFQAAVKANPKEPEVHFGLAYLYWTQRRYDDAIAEFQAELKNDPENSSAMIYLADTYVRQAQYDLARPLLQQALRYKPEVPLVHLNLGIVLMETDQKEAAIQELSKAVQLEPDNVAAHFRLATLYRGMGRKEEAKAEFAKASALTRKADEGLFQRISEAGARGKPQKDETKPQAEQPNP